MSYTETGFHTDATVDPVSGDVIVPPTDPMPEVQVVDLHGGYVLAVLSVEMNPDGNNMAERCKVRTILSQDTTGLGPQIATCLVAEYGLTPEEADALVPPELQTDAMKQAMEERAKAAEQRSAQEWQQHDAEAQAGFEHERARDEHGRFIAEEPAREA